MCVCWRRHWYMLNKTLDFWISGARAARLNSGSLLTWLVRTGEQAWTTSAESASAQRAAPLTSVTSAVRVNMS
jgi:hypothetical protein